MMRCVVALLVMIGLAPALMAHPVQSARGTLETDGAQVVLKLALGAEPMLAGTNLTGLLNTNDAANADEIDRYRAMRPDQLASEIRSASGRLLGPIVIATGDGTPIPLTLTGTEVDLVPNVELPRDSHLTITGPLPVGTTHVTVTWPLDYGALILRQIGLPEGEGYTGYFSGATSDPIAIAGAAPAGAWAVLLQYIPVGFEHIVPLGLDHILFVLALFFLSTRMGPLIWQVSAFTLAHTVTLALGALGIVTVPGTIVEPIIAASITYVAIENLFADRLHRWRPAVIFVFGLLHGLGFASVLAEFGLPQGQFVAGLIGFNIGVELGQLAIIAVAFGLVSAAMNQRRATVPYVVLAAAFLVLGWAINTDDFIRLFGAGAPVFFWPIAALCGLCALATWKGTEGSYRTYVARPVSLAIAAIGAFWFVERVFL